MSGKNGHPQPTIFEQLANMILALGASKSKAEAMARLSACQRMVKAIAQAFTLQAQKVAHLQTVLVQVTKGELRHLSLKVDGDPVNYKFTDQRGEPVWVVDPAQALVLVTPETVEPIIVDVELKDGTTTRIIVKHARSDEEAKKLHAEGAVEELPHEPLRVPVDEPQE